MLINVKCLEYSVEHSKYLIIVAITIWMVTMIMVVLIRVPAVK